MWWTYKHGTIIPLTILTVTTVINIPTLSQKMHLAILYIHTDLSEWNILDVGICILSTKSR